MKMAMKRWIPLLFLAVVIVGLICFAPEASAYEFYGDYTDVDVITDYGSCPSMQGLAVGSQYMYCVKIKTDETQAFITMTDKDTGSTTKLYNSDAGSYYFTNLGHANDMDVWGIDGYSNLFITTTNQGTDAIRRFKRSGSNLTEVATYNLKCDGADICSTALAVKSYSNGMITFISKWGMDVYIGSVDASLSSATINMTKICTLVKSQSYIKDTYEDLSAYTNQGFGYYDGTIFLPLSALDIMDNRSVVLVYNIDDALAGTGYSGYVYPIEHLNFRVTSGAYSALFEIESCDICSADGKLYFNTNRRVTSSDTNHDGVSSFDTYTYTKPTSQTTHFTIEYDANGGTGTMASTYIPYGYATPTRTNTFTRNGYSFAGWHAYRTTQDLWIYVDSSGNDGWYALGQQPDGYSLKVYTDGCQVSKTASIDNDVVIFYAQWEPLAQTYTIQYNANGGTGTMADTEVPYGYSTNLRTNTFTRPGYTFVGWVAYRTTQDQWYYTNGTSSGWYAQGSQPDGYTYAIYSDGVSVAKTTAVADDICIFYAQWELTDPEYYLVGYINGADYGCETDYENMGTYKFVDGKLVATFNQDSYVFLKTTDNAAWYMAQSYISGNSGTFYNTSTGAAEKMFVPGNQEITFTLTVNSDDTVSLSYVAVCEHSYTSSVTTAATCTAAGVRTYVCSICGDSYTESIAAAGHSYTTKVTAPTCTAVGYTTYTCSSCNDSYISDSVAATGHSYDSGKVTTAATCTTAGVKTYTCTTCGSTTTESIAVTDHSYTSVVTAPTCTAAGYTTYTCSGCGDSYLADGVAATGHSYSSVVTKPTCTTGGYTTYTCSSCGYSYTDNNTSATGHSYTSVVTAPTCTASGYTTYTCSGCGYSYTGNNTSATGHSYDSGKVTTAATCTTAGVKTYTCSGCSNTKTETISATGHNYTSVVTAPTCTTQGFTTFTCSSCGDSYTGNTVAMAAHSYDSGKVTTAATCTTTGVKTFTCINCGNTKTETIAVTGHSYTSAVTAPTCTAGGYTTYTCSSCGNSYTGDETAATGHSYVGGTCSVCGAEDPNYAPDYYLIGYINGANYGCEEDYANLGEYKFVNGQVVVTFDVDSYVFVKTGDNVNWFMFQSYVDTTSGTLYNTSTGTAEKMLVPGGVEVTFTLVENGDGSLTLSYEVAEEPVVVPTLTLSYPTLAFEDEILYNAYFTVSDTSSVVEMGMITFASRLTDGTIADAVNVISGYTTSGSNYIVHSNGVPAKNLGDALYFKVYAKLTDGSYVYTDVAGYNAIAYANTILNSASSSAKAKSLVVAMLNYGAAAQVQFGYNTDNLMNASLTAEQLALVDAYDESMVDAVVKADSAKVGLFVHNGGYTKVYPTVSFEGAFSINYYFATANTPDAAPVFYYWDAETYANATELTAENATGTISMTLDGDQWFGTVSGIAAKEIDQTYYTAGVYYVGDTAYYSPVVSYSLGNYCETLAAQDNAFGAATAVYGYYAKAYFA